MAYIEILSTPLINPIELHRVTNQYDAFFRQSIPSFEKQVDYYQKFQQDDYIQFQININTAYINKYGVICQLRQCGTDISYGNFVRVGDIFSYGSTNNMTMRLNLYNPVIPEGDYYVYLYLPYLNISGFEMFYSEPLSIKRTHENTIRLTFTNEGNDFDCYFYENHNYTSTRTFLIRVDGGFRSDGYQPSSNDSAFFDQTQNPVQLSSTPFDVHKLTIGDNYGIPNYIIKKINYLMSCTHWYINGDQYSKNDGAKLTRKETATNNPLSYWTIDVMTSVNSFSRGHSLKWQKPTLGIGTMQIGSTFIISPDMDTDVIAMPSTNGMVKPIKPIPIPALAAGVEQEIFHNLDTPNVIWMVRDVVNGNFPQFNVNKKSDANPNTAITLESEIDIAAGTLVLDAIGTYNP